MYVYQLFVYKTFLYCLHISQQSVLFTGHYDSKISPKGFLGATDSAVPCAQMLNLAHTIQMDLDDQKRSESELTLQFLFLDGEEAFKTWTHTDSIYGARHLAAKLDKESYSHQNVVGKSIERMDIFVLLDLLGAKDPQIFSIQKPTDVSY